TSIEMGRDREPDTPDPAIDKTAVSTIITAPASPNQALVQLPERSDASSHGGDGGDPTPAEMPEGPSGGPPAARSSLCPQARFEALMRLARSFVVVLISLVLVAGLTGGRAPPPPAAPARGAPRSRGPGPVGGAHLAGPDLVRSGRDLRHHHAFHGALRPARRAREA